MIEFNFLARGRGGHVLVVQQAVVALFAAVVGSFFGRQRLLFSLVRHSKWMLRDTWALVWVKTNGQFGANGDGRVFYRVFWKLFPTLGVGFSVELTTFVCPPHSADWLRCLCERLISPVLLNAPDPAPSQETRQPPLCVILTSHLPYIIICLRWVSDAAAAAKCKIVMTDGSSCIVLD